MAVSEHALSYSTFLGTTSEDHARCVAVAPDGSTYVAGYTEGSDFPTTVGAYNRTHGGGKDVYVVKFDADDTLAWSTLIGGAGDEEPYDVVATADGPWVVGHTDSPLFPTTPGCVNYTFGGVYDAFLMKLAENGSTLCVSTFLGGSGDDRGRALEFNSTGGILVTGITKSSDFPATAGAYDTTYGGGGNWDGWLMHIEPCGTLIRWCSYIGRNLVDLTFDLAVGAEDVPFVGGYTSSSTFPTSATGYDTTHNGGIDGFVLALNPDGASLNCSTFLGTSGSDYVYGVEADDRGYVYACGSTTGADFPTTYKAPNRTHGGGSDGYVLRMQPDVSGLCWSTLLGSAGDEVLYHMGVDSSYQAHAVGRWDGEFFQNTSDSYDAEYGGAWDGCMFVVGAEGRSLVYSTLLGHQQEDYVIDVDVAGYAVATCGYTKSWGFPTTGDAYDDIYGGAQDAFVTLFSTGEPAGAPEGPEQVTEEEPEGEEPTGRYPDHVGREEPEEPQPSFLAVYGWYVVWFSVLGVGCLVAFGVKKADGLAVMSVVTAFVVVAWHLLAAYSPAVLAGAVDFQDGALAALVGVFT
jgi:hypothetical protein